MDARRVMLLGAVLLALLLLVLAAGAEGRAPLSAKVQKQVNDRAYRLKEQSCRGPCGYSGGLDASEASINCWKRCISPACYEEHYGSDPCEEGEIDERLVAFKRCFFDETDEDSET